MAACFSCIGTLIYIESQGAASVLLGNVYHRDDTLAQNVCELCAIAAVGCHYNRDDVPTACENEFFRHAILLICDTLEQHTETAVKVIICLVTYMILTKIKSARAFTDCGLCLVRRLLFCLAHARELYGDEEVRVMKRMQSLATLERQYLALLAEV
ncbi:hypothetical protein BDV10DRAFT_190053 [Aspergillus recurvatus]